MVWDMNPDPLERVRAEAEVDATEMVAGALLEKGLDPRGLAAVMGWRRRRVKRLLRGQDIQLGDLAEVLFVLGYRLRLDRVQRDAE